MGNLCFDGAIWEIYGFWTQLYEMWKSAFNVESYIFFMHYESVAYFVSRLPPGLVIFQNYHFCFFFLPYPPSVSPSLPNETGQHFANAIIGRHSHLSPVGNLPLPSSPPPFPFPPLSFLPFRNYQGKEKGKGNGERGRLLGGESYGRRPVMKPIKCWPEETTGGGDGG